MQLNRIPHIYHNTKYVKKLFEIIKDKHIKIEQMWDEISKFNNLEKISGGLLDLKGGNYKISRFGRTDTEYRRVLKFEIPTFCFLGSPEEIKTILAGFYQIATENFIISELSGKIVIRIPSNIEKSEVEKNLKRLKAAGVGLQVDIEIYVEDFTMYELEEKTLEETEKITLARG